MTNHKVGTREEWQAARVTAARGLEPAMAYYGLLDRTPIGRNEYVSQPLWLRRHDEY
jgi:predicted dithiol-disulfide oxidoreductase (DUF899 family)